MNPQTIMNRRNFLLTLGSTALTFPWFSNLALHGAEASKAPRRLVCVGLDFGFRPESFFPTNQGPELELTPLLKPLERWQKKLTVFSQLEHPGVQGGHYGVHAFLSGVRREQAAGFTDGCVTLDQLAEEHLGGLTRFPSLCLGVGGGDAISWTRSGIAVPKLEDPGAAFDLLFKPQRQAAAAKRRAELSENESVLALISQDAKRVAPQLDRWDREKMEEFIGALRDFERANATNMAWLDKPLPTTDGKKPEWKSEGCMDKVRANYDLAALALQADATRIITLNIGGGLPVTNIPGINRGYHDLSHTGQDAEKLRQLHIIESALMAELDHFLERLGGMKDIGGGTLLDNTTVVFGSGMGNASSHANTNLPVVLAGGGFKHGRHLFFPKQARKQTPLCNLFVTLLQQMGIKRDKFGSSTGNLNEWLV
ncbi:MAG: DUF1552 domain-containing protein [Gammaproteobacteria bacterium]|nr:DUF1552 domain-containing protein [Gammaproteobacteria bacterium]